MGWQLLNLVVRSHELAKFVKFPQLFWKALNLVVVDFKLLEEINCRNFFWQTANHVLGQINEEQLFAKQVQAYEFQT